MKAMIIGQFKVIGVAVTEPGLVKIKLRSNAYRAARQPEFRRPGETLQRRYKVDERQDLAVYRWVAATPNEDEIHSALKGERHAWIMGELVVEKFEMKVDQNTGDPIHLCTIHMEVGADMQEGGASVLMMDLLSLREGWMAFASAQPDLFDMIDDSGSAA